MKDEIIHNSKIKHTFRYVTAKDAADLQRIQERAVKAVGHARNLIQVGLIASLIHIAKHGDRTVVDKFVVNLNETVNGKAVVNFLVEFGGLTIAEDGSGFNGWKGAKYIEEHLEKAKAKPWWEFKATNPFKGWSAEAALQLFIKQHKSMTAKLMTLPEADKAKVDVAVNDATLKQVLALCNFDAIVQDASETDKIAAEIAALEALV